MFCIYLSIIYSRIYSSTSIMNVHVFNFVLYRRNLADIHMPFNNNIPNMVTENQSQTYPKIDRYLRPRRQSGCGLHRLHRRHRRHFFLVTRAWGRKNPSNRTHAKKL